ncbi:MAG: prepilin-type N-terminal cleavage/methylation domain-containing protein [Candidatus Buchananbacteria bacterium]
MIKRKGFTLIELLVVIAIIGLLSTLAVISLNSARQKSRDARRLSDIKQVQTALELYYTDNNSYPATVTSGGTIGTYMTLVPTNPGPGGATYTYTQRDSGASYTIGYSIESAVGDITAGTHTATPSGLSNP